MKDRRTEGLYLIHRGILLSQISWMLVLLPYLAFDVLGLIPRLDGRLRIVPRFLFALVNVFQVLVSLTVLNGMALIAGWYPEFRKTIRLVLLRLGVGAFAAITESAVIAVASRWKNFLHLMQTEYHFGFTFRITNLLFYYLLSFAINMSLLANFSKLVYDYGEDPNEDPLLKHYKKRMPLYTMIPVAVMLLIRIVFILSGLTLDEGLSVMLGQRQESLAPALLICMLWILFLISVIGRIRYQFQVMYKSKELALRIEHISG
ncbi:MAG: hypothetical protein K6E18_07190 [Lachnospiraceae bacterium]|nr:hypothetical protein [Lachnospiraceae bacterium]